MPFLIDLHCHTSEKSFDGKHSAAELLRGLIAAGFNGAVLTDHNHTWREAELAALRVEVGLPDSFVLLAGQEVHVSHDGAMGDLLIYGPQDDFPDGLPFAEALALADAAGGFCLAPHPASRGGLGDLLEEQRPLGLEAWNGRYGSRAAAAATELALALNYPMFGGSDAHRASEVGGGGTLFDEPVTSFSQMRNAIAQRACEPWRPPFMQRAKRWLTSSGE